MAELHMLVRAGLLITLADLGTFLYQKTCSCPFVLYFCTLFWDDITIIWDENIVYFFH